MGRTMAIFLVICVSSLFLSVESGRELRVSGQNGRTILKAAEDSKQAPSHDHGANLYGNPNGALHPHSPQAQFDDFYLGQGGSYFRKNIDHNRHLSGRGPEFSSYDKPLDVYTQKHPHHHFNNVGHVPLNGLGVHAGIGPLAGHPLVPEHETLGPLLDPKELHHLKAHGYGLHGLHYGAAIHGKDHQEHGDLYSNNKVPGHPIGHGHVPANLPFPPPYGNLSPLGENHFGKDLVAPLHPDGGHGYGPGGNPLLRQPHLGQLGNPFVDPSHADKGVIRPPGLYGPGPLGHLRTKSLVNPAHLGQFGNPYVNLLNGAKGIIGPAGLYGPPGPLGTKGVSSANGYGDFQLHSENAAALLGYNAFFAPVDAGKVPLSPTKPLFQGPHGSPFLHPTHPEYLFNPAGPVHPPNYNAIDFETPKPPSTPLVPIYEKPFLEKQVQTIVVSAGGPKFVSGHANHGPPSYGYGKGESVSFIPYEGKSVYRTHGPPPAPVHVHNEYPAFTEEHLSPGPPYPENQSYDIRPEYSHSYGQKLPPNGRFSRNLLEKFDKTMSNIAYKTTLSLMDALTG